MANIRARPMWRHLRTTTACLFLALCIVTVTAWAYTYNANVEIVNNVEQWKYYSLESWKGKAQLGVFGGNKVRRINDWVVWRIQDEIMYNRYVTYSKEWEASSFDVSWTDQDKSLALPFWFLTLVTGSLAVVVKPKPRLKFSMNDLLIFMTTASLLVGTIAIVFKCID